MFDVSNVQTLSLEQCNRIGVSDTGNHITDTSYLIHDESTTIEMREVPQRRGGVRYSVDQQLNPETVGLKAGGRFGDNILISGQLGLGTGDAVSDELAMIILNELRKQFTKIKSYYVGMQAVSLLDSGARLTVNSAAATEYDLTR